MTKIGAGHFRLFLAAVVMLHHSFPLRLGAWAVYVFFVLSGYWICQIWRQRYMHTENPLLTFVVSRWWRLAPVFLVCTALSVASSFLLYGNGALRRADLAWWLRELLVAGSNGAGTDLPPSWSLDVEMQFYLVAPPLIVLFGRIGPFCRCLTIAVATGWLVQFVLRGGDMQLAHLSLFLGFFLIGVTVQLSKWKPSRRTAMGSLLTFFGITFVLAIHPCTQQGIWRVGADAVPLHDDFSGIAASVWWIVGAGVVVPFLAWNVSQSSTQFDRFLGNLAYPLYLFHWLPRDWYYHFSSRSDPLWQQGAFLAINFLAAAVGALIVLFLVDQPSERLREVWVSSRQKKFKAHENIFAVAARSTVQPARRRAGDGRSEAIQGDR